MIDTINLFLRGACVKQAPPLSRVAEHHREGSNYITGNLQNLNILIGESGISIKGSLAKWFLKSNTETLTRSDTKRAIEALSDTMNLSLSTAKITRVDVAKNFIMNHPTGIYYPYLGDCQFYKRFTKSDALYYENPNRIKLFYDKNAEAKFRGEEVHNILKNQNLLRFEVRFIKRFNKLLNVPELTAQMLYDEEFHINLVNKWVKEYETINKLSKMAFKENIQLEPKDFINQILLKSFIELGGQNQVFELIEEIRKKGQFKRPEYASRTKAMVKDLFQLDKLTESSDLIEELDKKIKQVKVYYR